MPSTTTTRCDTLDQILEWTTAEGELQIHEGDLVVDAGELKQLDSVTLVEDGKFVRYSFDVQHGMDFALPTDLVAVRRYIETGPSR